MMFPCFFNKCTVREINWLGTRKRANQLEGLTGGWVGWCQVRTNLEQQGPHSLLSFFMWTYFIPNFSLSVTEPVCRWWGGGLLWSGWLLQFIYITAYSSKILKHSIRLLGKKKHLHFKTEKPSPLPPNPHPEKKKKRKDYDQRSFLLWHYNSGPLTISNTFFFSFKYKDRLHFFFFPFLFKQCYISNKCI